MELLNIMCASPNQVANATPLPAISAKFSAFNLVDVVYKSVDDTPIQASILIPKDIKPRKHPLMIRWHGGFLVTGNRLFQDWYPQWTLDLALKHQAIIVTPDHRLMPEATGLDILQDVKDFFTWLLTPGNMAQHMRNSVEVDLHNILMNGESAGGWLAWQSAVLHPERIAAVVAHYPMLDMHAPQFMEKYEKQLFTPPAPQLPVHILDDFLQNLKGNEVVTSATPPERLPLGLVILQQGRTAEFFGTDRSLYPLDMLDDMTSMPPTWILHGKDDSAVPVQGTRNYAAELHRKLPEARLHLSLEEGEHGFDNHGPNGEPASLETDWVKKGADFIERYWPVSV
ncbi:hypothetical protein LTR85_006419 [Meristemomyces frigidus]|nr:hypothetical protein LTR85_006419 [Meristemomyces frigidus]